MPASYQQIPGYTFRPSVGFWYRDLDGAGPFIVDISGVARAMGDTASQAFPLSCPAGLSGALTALVSGNTAVALNPGTVQGIMLYNPGPLPISCRVGASNVDLTGTPMILAPGEKSTYRLDTATYLIASVPSGTGQVLTYWLGNGI